MKKHLVTALVVCVLSLAFMPEWVAADTRYVADQLVITLREGMGNEYRVKRTIKTDTRMEVLEEQGRYLRVRLNDGTEGYVLTQYVSTQRPKSQIIKELEAEVEGLRSQTEAQADAVADAEQMRAEVELLQQRVQRKEEELVEIRELSDNALMLDEERKRLKLELDAAQEELNMLREENRTILSTASTKWFLAGGGTLFVGWVMGKLSRRKKRRDFSGI
ncbi:MAG: TIGR04211 family SH3 domain-containing protein [Desulfuromonadaceae bacterium]|nr:TIGR04211 family SH3 domain-containing protein [Desulfuromonadaceae bacterium]